MASKSDLPENANPHHSSSFRPTPVAAASPNKRRAFLFGRIAYVVLSLAVVVAVGYLIYAGTTVFPNNRGLAIAAFAIAFITGSSLLRRLARWHRKLIEEYYMGDSIRSDNRPVDKSEA